jgi:DNA-binding Lrp family transcriptional regulator
VILQSSLQKDVSQLEEGLGVSQKAITARIRRAVAP